MIDWDKVRHDFPVTENGAYFLSAAMTPPPRPVFEAISSHYEALYRQGDVHWTVEMKRYRALCARLAGLIQGGPDDVAFVPNTSTAMAILGLSFQEEGRAPFNIVSLQDEFPSSTVPFEYLKFPVRYAQPVGGRYAVASILDLTDKETRAVVASHVQYATGFRLDLLGLGRELERRGILFIVNATQGLPYYPVDVKAMSIDALTCSLHKWGMTGHVGSMFYTSPDFRERYPSPLAGWLSVAAEGEEGIHTAKNVPFRLLDSAHRYELGTFNLNAVLSLSAALDYLEAIGFEAIRARILELADHLIHGLRALGVEVVSPFSRQEERSAIVSFSLGDRNPDCVKKLAVAGVYVSLRAGLVRVALNIFNNIQDIDRLVEVVRGL
jgi:cysteine desulfurase/selenocysteine lyase